MPALSPVTLQQALRRVLPGRRTETVRKGAAFSSGI
jgi:hypothetical protein